MQIITATKVTLSEPLPTQIDQFQSLDNHGGTVLQVGDLKISIEYLTKAGFQRKVNEDAFIVKLFPNGRLLVAVCDGCTSLNSISEISNLGMSEAQWASRFVVKKLLELDRITDLREVVLDINSQMGVELQSFSGININLAHTLPGTTFTGVLFSDDFSEGELVHLGDTFAIVEKRSGGVELVTSDKVESCDQEHYSFIAETAKKRGITLNEATKQPEVLQRIREVRDLRWNGKDGAGWGIINGSPQVESYLEKSTLSFLNISSLVIGTDGIVPPNIKLLEGDGPKELLTKAVSSGLEGFYQDKIALEDSDPDLSRYPRFKRSDDASVVKITKI